LRQFILFLLLVCCLQCPKAQQSNYLFQRLGVNDGLFEETVHGVQQDAKGFLWLNFRTLIQRYDGYRLLNFYPGTQLPDGNVRAMVIDKKNRLWLLSGDATLGYLDPDNFKYHSAKVNIPRGFNHIVTGAYLNRNDEMMLLWDKQGFITYSNKTGAADAGNNPFVLPQGWEPLHIWEDGALNYWMGTRSGLVKYNPVAKTISYRGHNDDNDAAINAFEQLTNINSVYIDKSKNCWVITWEGGLKIVSYNYSSRKKMDWAPKLNPLLNKYYVPYGFTETSGDELWLTGISIFCKINTADETAEVVPRQSSAEYSILYDMIFSLYEDKEKNIWVGTNKGLFRFNPPGQLFTIRASSKPGKNKSISTEVTDFLETKDGEILVSTWGAGLFSYNQQWQPVASANLYQQKRMDGTMVWSMIQRANGDVWCGMQNGALFIFEAATKKFIHELPKEAEGKTIRQLAEDKDGNIWMGTHGGAVIQWNAAQGTFTKLLQADALISRLYVDSHNQLWVGTDRDGLYCLNSTNGKVLHHYVSSAPKNKKLMINGVADILQYNDSVFYIAGNGLNILNTKTNLFSYYTVAKGLPSANITNLLKDKNGYIWMTSGSGIISHHPEKQRLSYYDARDGVPNYSFNSGAAAILKNGNIAFGTNKDILLFNPDELKKRIYHPPKVQIAGIEIMGKPKNVDSLLQLPAIELQHNQNAFKAFFTTLKYKDVHAVYYMLEGIDKVWKKADKTNVVEYNYVPNGTYALKAACFHEDGKLGEITSLKIHIAAPFYKTWWFYSLLVLAAGSLLFWFDRERTKRKEAMQQMRSNIAANLHEQVNTALSNINILSEMASLKADTEPQKSKEFIEQIHSKSHNMMIAMDDMLWAISPENDSMAKTVERMQEYIDALNNRHEAHIEMLVEEKVKSLNIDMQLRHEAFLLFKEGLSGLLKAGARECKIQLRLEKSHLLYIIECKNNNSDMQQLNYLLNGREFKSRLDAINAKMDIAVHKSISVLRCRIHL
jgi:ligand-binding sensor domain-containing protein